MHLISLICCITCVLKFQILELFASTILIWAIIEDYSTSIFGIFPIVLHQKGCCPHCYQHSCRDEKSHSCQTCRSAIDGKEKSQLNSTTPRNQHHTRLQSALPLHTDYKAPQPLYTQVTKPIGFHTPHDGYNNPNNQEETSETLTASLNIPKQENPYLHIPS